MNRKALSIRANVFAVVLVLASACATAPASSPYVGEEGRAIKALSQKEAADLLEGAGMGYAKAAELNRYPGPSHVLDMDRALELTPSQRTAIEEILRSHKAEARKLGSDVVELERQLDRLFADDRASAQNVEGAVARIAAVAGVLRASHLKAHVATTAVLSPTQVARYVQMRGYGEAHQH
jgi:DNA-binding MarR family transcriptional regulator